MPVILGWPSPSSDLATLLSFPARARENPAHQFPVQHLHHIQQFGCNFVTRSQGQHVPGELKRELQNQQPHQNNCTALRHPGLLANSGPCPLKPILRRGVFSRCEHAEPSPAGRQERCSPCSSLAGVSPSLTGTMELFPSPQPWGPLKGTPPRRCPSTLQGTVQLPNTKLLYQLPH